MKNRLLDLPNTTFNKFKLFNLVVIFILAGISCLHSQLGPGSASQFTSMTTTEYNHCNNSITLRFPIKENFNDCAIANFLNFAQISVHRNNVFQSVSRIRYNDGIQTCAGFIERGTLQGECRSWLHCADDSGPTSTFLIYPVGEYGSYGEFTFDADINATYTIDLVGNFEGVGGGGSFTFNSSIGYTTPNNTEDVFCTYQRGTNDVLYTNPDPDYPFQQCQFSPLEDVWHIQLPGGIQTEHIRIRPDGIIWHGATLAELNDPTMRQVDHSIVYLDHNGASGTPKHASFDKGLFFIRTYNPTTQLPIGPVIEVTSGLKYKSADPDAMDKYGSENLEGFVQNTFFSVKEIEYLGFGNSNMTQMNLWGLPLQNYQTESDTKFEFHPYIDHSRTGSIFRYHDFQIDANGNLINGNYQPFAQLEVNNLQDQFFLNYLSHVLPNEADRFYMDMIDIRAGSCANGNMQDLIPKLFIVNNAFALPNVNTTPVAIGQLEGSGPNSRYKFDLSSLDRTGGPNSYSGEKFFMISLTDDDNPNTIQHLYGLPVFIEAPSGPKIPFGHPGIGPPEVKMIVHDPPGNQSFASYQAGTEVCYVEENVSDVVDGFESDHRIQVGFSGSVGEYVTGNIDINVGYHGGIETTETALTSSSREVCTRFTQTIETNPSNGFLDRGDVFMGYAKEFQLWSADRWNWDVDDGELYPGHTLFMEILDLQEFALVEEDIRLEICQLEVQYQNFGPTITDLDRRDKAYILQSIETWQNVLADNRRTLADPSIPVNVIPEVFSAGGVPKTVMSETATTMARTEGMELITTEDHGVDQTVLIVGNGFEGAQTWTVENRLSNSETNTSGASNTISYTLSDMGGSIDLNKTTIHEDERYGVPFFRVTADSRTSCPFEGGQRVEQPNIKERIDPALNPIPSMIHNTKSNQIYISNVPTGTAVRIPIDLCNLFEFTDPNVTGSFRIIREGTSGNGAFVGISESDPLPDNIVDAFPVDIDYGSCFGDDVNQTAISIFVKQNLSNDLEYSEATDEIRLRMHTECDDDIYDVLSISVRFVTDPNATINYHAECEFLQDTDRAIHFDGVDDHITNRIKAAPFVYNRFSYEFWANPEGTIISQAESNTLNTLSAASSTGGFPFVIFPVDGLNDLYGIGDGTRSVQTKDQAAVGIAVGANGVQVVEHYDKTHTPVVLQYSGSIDGWNHIAVVYDRRIPKLYVNGELVRTGSPSAFLALHPSAQIGGGDIIAPNDNAIPNYYKGKIDDLRFWNYSRTENQINADINNKLSGNEPGLMALYLFDGQAPGAANQGHGILEYAGIGEESDSELQNFNYNATTSNWVAGRVANNCDISIPKKIFVFKTATGLNDGTTWNNAFNYLQDAIAASVSGDTICVAAGEYYPCFGANQPDDQTASFSLKNGVVMLGGFEGTESSFFDVNQRDIRSNETVLSGEACGSYHVVYNTNLNNTAVLDGFSITRGVAQNSPTDTNGGGIYNDNSSPVIKNCFIHRNQADVGAGIYNINNSNPTTTNCNFMKNFAFSTGGAIAIAGSTPTISYCSFSGNTGVVNGPAIRVFSSGNVNVSHSIFWGNGSGSGVTNIDILYSAGSGTCDYCIIDADGGSTYPGIGGLNQDPLFVEASPEGPIWNIGGDLRLQSGSPAIDFLVDPSAPITDQDGKLRPIGAGHDIGAYEYGMSISDMDNDGISDLTDLCPDDKDTALNFDGINDYVLLPNESNFDITGAITVEAWIKVDEFDIPNQAIVTKGDNTWRIARNYINSSISLALNGVGQLDGTIEVDDNRWHHIAGVYNGSVMSLYIDGILDTNMNSTASIATSDDPVLIGANYQGGPTRFFDGSIDDVLIWNRALSQQEIQNSMAAAVNPTAPGLVAYYQFSDGLACITSSQTTAVDAGPLANTGTLMNFSLANDCVSNWSSGRNLDSDGDGIGDACDIYEELCATNQNLTGDQSTTIEYISGDYIESTQNILAPADVEYNAASEVRLNEGFEVKTGATFHAFIDGCGG